MGATAEADLLVRGDLVLPGRVLRDGALAVTGGRIAAVLEGTIEIAARDVVDARGRLVFPGLVDSHVHTLSAATEGIATATAAAAAGGVTTILDMPYDSPGPVNNIDRLREKVGEVRAGAHVDVGLYGTIAKVDGLEALPELLRGGVLAFKFSLFETDPVRFPRILDGDLHAAFGALASTDLPIVLHAEMEEVIRSLLAKHGDEQDPLVHGRTRPVVSETGAIVKALELALWTGARVHIAHVTHPRGFELIDRYRRWGARVSGETCVQYLALTEDDVVGLGAIAKVNPPIRDKAAQVGLWRDLLAGRVATVSTDHAPWPVEAKQRPILSAASGIPGLDTFLPVMHTEAARRGLLLDRLAHFVSSAPADIFGLGGRKGRLAVGHDADFVVFDPHETWRFDASRALSSAKWSPFDGRELTGRVLATYVRGHRVFEEGQVVAPPGSGVWLRRDAST